MVSIKFIQGQEEDGPFSLATTNGWSLFRAWARQSKALSQLFTSGIYVGTDRLSKALIEAIRQFPPRGSVLSTVNGLGRILGVGDQSETAVILSEHHDD